MFSISKKHEGQRGPLAIKDREPPVRGPPLPAAEKLEEQTMIKVEEALVCITQCKKDAGKALSKEFKGATSALIKGNLKDKVSELIHMQSKMEEIKIFGMGDFHTVRTLLTNVDKCLLVVYFKFSSTYVFYVFVFKILFWLDHHYSW